MGLKESETVELKKSLTAKELENLILARNREAIRWDNQPGAASIKDLSEKKIKAFVKRAGLRWDNITNVLEKLGLIKDGQLFNAALLFFARKPPPKPKPPPQANRARAGKRRQTTTSLRYFKEMEHYGNPGFDSHRHKMALESA